MKKCVKKRRKDGVKQRYHVNVARRRRIENVTPDELFPESGLSESEREKVRELYIDQSTPDLRALEQEEAELRALLEPQKTVRKKASKSGPIKKKTVIEYYPRSRMSPQLRRELMTRRDKLELLKEDSDNPDFVEWRIRNIDHYLHSRRRGGSL